MVAAPALNAAGGGYAKTHMQNVALVDANAFYCSAQILFQPWLRDRAVVVASNGDGCVVSRNDHAKALGIKMGQPVFELRNLVRRNRVVVFSATILCTNPSATA